LTRRRLCCPPVRLHPSRVHHRRRLHCHPLRCRRRRATRDAHFPARARARETPRWLRRCPTLPPRGSPPQPPGHRHPPRNARWRWAHSCRRRRHLQPRNRRRRASPSAPPLERATQPRCPSEPATRTPAASAARRWWPARRRHPPGRHPHPRPRSLHREWHRCLPVPRHRRGRRTVRRLPPRSRRQGR